MIAFLRSHPLSLMFWISSVCSIVESDDQKCLITIPFQVSSFGLNPDEQSELLKLLRGINEKLSRDREQSVLSNAQTDKSIAAPSRLWRWYEKTYATPKKARCFQLPTARLDSPALGDEISPFDSEESLKNDIEYYK